MMLATMMFFSLAATSIGHTNGIERLLAESTSQQKMAEGTGTLILFRGGGMNENLRRTSPIYCDGAMVADSLARNRYFSVGLPSGKHSCYSSGGPSAGVSFEIAAEQILYIKVSMAISTAKFALLEPAQGKREVASKSPEDGQHVKVRDVPRGFASEPCFRALSSKYFKVLADGLPGNPERGQSGDSEQFSAEIAVDSGGQFTARGALSSFRPGEIVRASLIGSGFGPARAMFTSIIKHSITRGSGAFRHQTGELLRATLTIAEGMTCDQFSKALSSKLEEVSEDQARAWALSFPSGVMVDEVRQGMTFAEVEAMLGPPSRKAVLENRVVYFYPEMKITFVGGKVADIE
jgi:hypothetical protein